MNLIQLKIITPNGIKFDKKIKIFNTRTPNGAIGINANQTGLIAKLVNYTCSITIDDKTKIEYVILDGLLYSTKDMIKVFANYCEEKNKIDISKIKKEIELLTKTFNNNKDVVSHESTDFKLKQNKAILDALK